MRLSILGAWVLAFVALGQDNVIGLLKLPEVFGDASWESFTASELKLFAAAGSKRAIGSIRADKFWTVSDGVRYEGTRANVYLGKGMKPLPALEYGYEISAAIVVEQRGRWFRLRLADGTAWHFASERAEFLPLERLLASELAHITEETNGRLVRFPGEAEEAGSTQLERNTTVRVLELRWCSGRQWVHIEALSHSFCESGDKPRVTAKGWMPAHGASGEPTIWFPSRGC